MEHLNQYSQVVIEIPELKHNWWRIFCFYYGYYYYCYSYYYYYYYYVLITIYLWDPEKNKTENPKTELEPREIHNSTK